jgi:uncharacterized protein GlcG (DUF336 family)
VSKDGLVSGSDVGSALALAILRHVHDEGAKMGLAFSGVVTDRAGHVVASARMDGAPLGAMPIAVDKAYTAALWGATSGSMGPVSVPGEGDWGFANTIGGRMVVFAGGVPIFADGAQVGALGVSGALSSEDEQVAIAALKAAGLSHEA